MGLLLSFTRSGKIDDARKNIKKHYDRLYDIAIKKDDKIAKSFLGYEVHDTLVKINSAYLEDGKYTKALVMMFQTTEECLDKICLIFSSDESTHYKELMYLLLDFLNEKYLARGRKGALSKEDVEVFRNRFFKEYFPIINDLTEKLSKQKRYLNKLQEAYDQYEEIRKSSSKKQGANNQLQVQANRLVEEYNVTVNFIETFSRAINDKIDQLNILIKKDLLLLYAYDEGAAPSAYDNSRLAKEIIKQSDIDHKLIQEAKRDIFGDISNELIPIESSAPTVTSSGEVQTSIMENIKTLLEVQTNKIIQEVKVNRTRAQSYFDKTIGKINELKDIVKLNNDQLVKTIADLFEANIKREEAGEVDSSSKEETLPYEAEMAKRIANNKLSTKETIDLLINLEPPKYVGAYALIRTLIDSYCRFEKGIELNEKQRIFKPVDSKGNVLKNNYEIFRYALGSKGNPAVIDSVWKECNQGVHGNFVQLGGNEDEIVSRIKEYSKFVLEDLKLDYSKIDYTKGAKQLYEKEVHDINRLVDGDYEEGELSSKGTSLLDIRKYAMKRINGLKKYLTGKVEPEYFISIGEPKDFSKSK